MTWPRPRKSRSWKTHEAALRGLLFRLLFRPVAFTVSASENERRGPSGVNRSGPAPQSLPACKPAVS